MTIKQFKQHCVEAYNAPQKDQKLNKKQKKTSDYNNELLNYSLNYLLDDLEETIKIKDINYELQDTTKNILLEYGYSRNILDALYHDCSNLFKVNYKGIEIYCFIFSTNIVYNGNEHGSIFDMEDITDYTLMPFQVSLTFDDFDGNYILPENVNDEEEYYENNYNFQKLSDALNFIDSIKENDYINDIDMLWTTKFNSGIDENIKQGYIDLYKKYNRKEILNNLEIEKDEYDRMIDYEINRICEKED